MRSISTVEIYPEITDFFNEIVRGAIYNDISNATEKASANSLVALGLSVYTEVLGGLVTGHLKDLTKPRSNYKAFLSYLGPPYVKLDQSLDLYRVVRCGLVHQYFIKKPHVVARTLLDALGSDAAPGITYFPKGTKLTEEASGATQTFPPETVIFGIRNYFRDFKQAVEKYYQDLMLRESKVLRHNFKVALS